MNGLRLCAANKVQREKCKFNLELSNSSQVTFGTKGLRVQRPKVCNSLPYHNKVAENLKIFTTVVKFWDRKTYSCSVYSIYNKESYS